MEQQAEQLGADQQEDDYGDYLESRIVAMDYKGHRFGVSYYEADHKTLCLSHDTFEDAPFDLVRMACFQLDPEVLLLTSRAEVAFESVFSSVEMSRIRMEIRPGSEFGIASAKHKLLALMSDEDTSSNRCFRVFFGPDVGTEDAYHKIAHAKLQSYIDNDAVVSSGCAGAILSFLQRREMIGRLPGDAVAKHDIRSVDMFSLFVIVSSPTC